MSSLPLMGPHPKSIEPPVDTTSKIAMISQKVGGDSCCQDKKLLNESLQLSKIMVVCMGNYSCKLSGL